MTAQLAVTIVADVKPRRVTALDRLLKKMGADAAGNDVLPLGELSSAHFARLIMLGPETDLNGDPLPAHLIYMSDVDGSMEAHLEELVDLAPQGLDQILAHCEGYPATTASRSRSRSPSRSPSPSRSRSRSRNPSPTREERLAYLNRRAVKAGAMYVNTVGRTLTQIRDEARLRDEIQAFLDGGDFDGVEPEAARDAVRRFVKARPELRWAAEPAPSPGPLERAADLVKAAGLPLELIALAPVIGPLLPVWALLLRVHELRDPAPTIAPTDAHNRALAALEDHAAINPFSALGERKPGLTRLVTAASILRLVDYGARYIFNRGSLTGVTTIHFARWVFLDDRRRMIFASNYDGSLESYMDDFINQVWWGLNAVFSNGVGYPRTSWLVFGGAKNEQAFKDYLRRHQVPTQVWYAAYDELTALNIDNNAEIRAGLSKAMSRQETEAWLQRL